MQFYSMAYVVAVEANIFYEKSVISERHCRSAAKTAKKNNKRRTTHGHAHTIFLHKKTHRQMSLVYVFSLL